MSYDTRNFDNYVQQYLSLPFEPIQIEYRRQLVLRQVQQLAPGRLLEVGCGVKPLFIDLPDDILITVVEPAHAFADRAEQLACGRDHVKILRGFMESVDLGTAGFDMIILSCVLHEVPDPLPMLGAIREYCSSATTLHVNVPNSRSLHRLWAVAMGLLPSQNQQSATQRLMQQRATAYDSQSLRAELVSSGFAVVDEGSFFVKPFSHAQMQALVDSGFMTREMLDGLDRLADLLPDLGSEIWANARRVE